MAVAGADIIEHCGGDRFGRDTWVKHGLVDAANVSGGDPLRAAAQEEVLRKR